MKATRQSVYDAIDGERDYQHKACIERGWTESKSLGEFILTISGLVEKAKDEWYIESDSNPINTLPNIRKLAAVAVAALEGHGAPTRNFVKEIQAEVIADPADKGEKMFFKKE